MSINRSSRKAARQSSNSNNARTRRAFYSRTARFESLEDRRLLANVTVTTLADTIDFNDGKTSLREAIFATNTVSGADTIDFAPALTANGPATILLTQGELKITDALTITGPGVSLLTIDASGSDPTPGIVDYKGSSIFVVNDQTTSQVVVSIDGLRLTGSDANAGTIRSREDLRLADMVVEKNAGTDNIINASTLTIDRTRIVNNTIVGGLAWDATILAAPLTIRDSEVSNNKGAGINANGAQVVISGTTIANNSGAGVMLQETIAEVTHSTITDNVGRRGGLWCYGVTSLLIEDCTIARNVASYNDGGGAFVYFSGGGTAVIKSSSFIDNRGSSGGGLLLRGNAQIVDCEFVGNTATSDSGGGLAINSAQTVEISGTIFRENSSRRDGGAIYLVAGFDTLVSLTDVLIVANTASADGGGIASRSTSHVVVRRSTIEGNHATIGGGGAFILGRLLQIENSTFDLNTAKSGGALLVDGISNVTILQTTVSGNSGGGLELSAAGNVAMANSTITQNAFPRGSGISASDFVGTLQMTHTIVAGNVSSSGGQDFNSSARTLDVSFSLIGSNAGNGLAPAPIGSPDARGNLIGDSTTSSLIEPNLAALADNGGPTKTHALLPGSPATNAGDPAAMAGVGGVPVNDQRGTPFTRVYGGRIDIGAFEFQPIDHVLGDFNLDGTVDALDYTLYRRQLGQTVAAGTGADANGDGKVDDADGRVWKANYGATESQLPRLVQAPAFGLGEEMASTPTTLLGPLSPPSQIEASPDLISQSSPARMAAFGTAPQEVAPRKVSRVWSSSSTQLQVADDARQIDRAIESWRGSGMLDDQHLYDFDAMQQSASRPLHGMAKAVSSVASSLDMAFGDSDLA